MLALLGVATVSLAGAGLAWGHRNEHGAATLASEVVAAVGYAIVAFAVWERLRQSNVFATGPFWFCIAEIALVITAVAAFAYWGQWWIDGERFTGVIVEIDDIEHVVIRDPGTERSVEASLSIWPWDDFEVGDTTTVLIDRDDPAMVAAAIEVQVMIAILVVVPLLLALALLIRGWRIAQDRLPLRATTQFRHDRALRSPANHSGGCQDDL